MISRSTYFLLFIFLSLALIACESESTQVEYHASNFEIIEPIRDILEHEDSVLLVGGDDKGFIATSGLDMAKIALGSKRFGQPIYSAAYFNNHWYLGMANASFQRGTTLNSISPLYIERQNWIGTEYQHQVRKMVSTDSQMFAIVGGKLAFGVVYSMDIIQPDWNPYSIENELRALSVLEEDGSVHVWVGGNGVMLKKELGSEWRRLNVKEGFISAIHFFNLNDGLAVTYDGEILITSDGGESWDTKMKANGKKGVNGLKFFSNIGVIAANSGHFAISTDNGNTWGWYELSQADLDIYDAYLSHGKLWLGTSAGLGYVMLNDLI